MQHPMSSTTTPKQTRFDDNVQSSRPLTDLQWDAFDRFEADSTRACTFCKRRHPGPCRSSMDTLGSSFGRSIAMDKDLNYRDITNGDHVEIPSKHQREVFVASPPTDHHNSPPSSNQYYGPNRQSPPAPNNQYYTQNKPSPPLPPDRIWRPSSAPPPDSSRWNSPPNFPIGGAGTTHRPTDYSSSLPRDDYRRPSMSDYDRPSTNDHTRPPISDYARSSMAHPSMSEYNQPPMGDYTRPPMTDSTRSMPIPSRPASSYQPSPPSEYNSYGTHSGLGRSAPTYTPPPLPSHTFPQQSQYTPAENIPGNVRRPSQTNRSIPIERSAPIDIPSRTPNRNVPFSEPSSYTGGQYSSPPSRTYSGGPIYAASAKFPEVRSNGMFSERLPTFNSDTVRRPSQYQHPSLPSQPQSWMRPSGGSSHALPCFSGQPYQPQSHDFTPSYNSSPPFYQPQPRRYTPAFYQPHPNSYTPPYNGNPQSYPQSYHPSFHPPY